MILITLNSEVYVPLLGGILAVGRFVGATLHHSPGPLPGKSSWEALVCPWLDLLGHKAMLQESCISLFSK